MWWEEVLVVHMLVGASAWAFAAWLAEGLAVAGSGYTGEVEIDRDQAHIERLDLGASVLGFAGPAGSGEDRCAKARPLACWKQQPVSAFAFASAFESESAAFHIPKEDGQEGQEKEVGISAGNPGACWAPYRSWRASEEAGGLCASVALDLGHASHVASETGVPLGARWLG